MSLAGEPGEYNGYIWRAGPDPAAGRGIKEDAEDVIKFENATIGDGKYVRSTEVHLSPGFAENERPLSFNQLQDTGLNTVEYTIVGHAHNPQGNDITDTVKRWMVEPKADETYPKGRFGIQLGIMGGYDVVPSSIGGSSEQARGLFLTEWRWMHSAEWPGKLDFTAAFRFNGDYGTAGTNPPYNWTVRHA